MNRWAALPGEKHLLHVPNADHGFTWIPGSDDPGLTVMWGALASFYAQVVEGAARPVVTWSISDDGSSIHVQDKTTGPRGGGAGGGHKVNVSVWAATTTNGNRDFRLLTCRTGNVDPGDANPAHGHNCTHPGASPADPSE
jgi:hypothetical protein